MSDIAKQIVWPTTIFGIVAVIATAYVLTHQQASFPPPLERSAPAIQAEAIVAPPVARPSAPQRQPAVQEPAAGSLSAVTPAAFQNPQISAQVIDLLGRLKSIPGASAAGAPRVAYIFFDPRCPYCHQAFDEIDSQIPVRWIPLAVLEPAAGGERIVAELLKDGNGSARLPDAFNKRLAGEEPTEAIRQTLYENTEAFLAIHQSSRQGAGVPTMLVPRPDGTIYFQVGFERGDAQKVVSAFKEGKR